MSPYKVKLLVHIDSCDDSVSFNKTTHLVATLCKLSMERLIESKITGTSIAYDPVNWKTTKLGRIVCDRLYNVEQDNIKFCEECGQVITVE